MYEFSVNLNFSSKALFDKSAISNMHYVVTHSDFIWFNRNVDFHSTIFAEDFHVIK